jgi:hypothetical protein
MNSEQNKKWYKNPGYVLGAFAIAGSAFALGNTTSQPQVTPVIAPAAAVQAVTPAAPPESIQTVETVETTATPIVVPTTVPVTKTEPPPAPKKSAPVQETYSVPEQTVSEPDCHPGYSGCLNPNASDYDCAGGSGNGPYYTGPVQVYGSDPFDLDRDNDGWGCE